MGIDFKTEYLLPDKFEATDIPNAEEFNAAYASGFVNQSTLNILGNFWYEKFREDYNTLGKISGAVTAKLGGEYLRLLRLVLSSSIIDTPVTSPVRQDLYAFNKQEASFVYDPENPEVLRYISFDFPDVQSVEYLHTQLFGSKVILDRDNYFEIVEGRIRFYVDIFSDQTILTNSYVFGTGNQVILFWASDICFQETYLYDRYGRYLYSKQLNSVGYKNRLTALQYFFTQTKSVSNIEAVLNILFGMPYSKYAGETVLAVTTVNSAGDTVEDVSALNLNAEADSPDELKGLGWVHQVKTDQTTYQVPLYADLQVTTGQKLEKYRLIGRAHKAHDYLTTPDWYEGAKFPFELVDELKDFSVIDTPTEFHSYIPHRCDGSVEYDGEFKHTGEYQTFAGIDPFSNTRSRSEAAGGSEFEQALYDLVDQVLKYNLLYFETRLNFENVDYYLDNNIKDSLEVIRKGVPSYLHPVIDTSFSAEFVDSIEELDGDAEVRSDISPGEDLRFLCPERSYNGAVTLSNPVAYTYAGAFSYEDKARCYPYGGDNGTFYDCSQEEKTREGQLTSAEETLKLFGFYPERTFEPPGEYYEHDGTLGYGQEVALSAHRAKWETSAAQATLSAFQEDPIPVVEDHTSDGRVGMEDQAGSYGGQVGCSNADIHKYGALETQVNLYSAARAYGEAIPLGEEVVVPCVIKCDGVKTYKGYSITGFTYGDTLPRNINVTDALSVNVKKKKTTTTIPEMTDTFQAFGFYPERTFEPAEGYYEFDGTQAYDQEVPLDTHRADWETSAASGEFAETVEYGPMALDEESALALQTESMEDRVGSYGAGLPCSNVEPVTYGAVDSKFHKYDGAVQYTRTALTYFAITPNEFLCDNTQTYSGYNVTGFTYGDTLPGNINTTDALTVNIRRR